MAGTGNLPCKERTLNLFLRFVLMSHSMTSKLISVTPAVGPKSHKILNVCCVGAVFLEVKKDPSIKRPDPVEGMVVSGINASP